MKTYPKVGDELYISQRGNADYWCAMVKTPYTVIFVSPKEIIVAEARLIFKGPRYYDTPADKIEFDPNGRRVRLHWSEKLCGGCWWDYSSPRSCPEVATFGKYEYQPYLI